MDQLTQGFLLAFENLNVGPSYDLEAVTWKGDHVTSVRNHFCSADASWAVSIRSVEQGTEVLHRWLFDRHFGAPEGNEASSRRTRASRRSWTC